MFLMGFALGVMVGAASLLVLFYWVADDVSDADDLDGEDILNLYDLDADLHEAGRSGRVPDRVPGASGQGLRST